MLTVAEALETEHFHGARVVAGAAGVDHLIHWVHVTATPDAPEWLNGGELVLTTALNLPETPAEQARYIDAMARKGVAGLALAVGRYVDHAPDALCQAADAANFPLIEIPFQARFVDIARDMNQRIAQENLGLFERALHIQRVLTQLVLDGGDLKQLAITMAGLIGQSISIESERFEALAAHNIGAFDEARRYTLAEGRTDPRLIAALEDRGYLGEIRRTLRAVHLPQQPDVGLEMERILAPVVVHGNIYGYLWIIADDRPLSPLDTMAIESGATVAALILLHQETLQNAEASLKGGLLSQLIEGEGARRDVLTDQALRYGVNLAEPFVLLLLEPAERGAGRLPALIRRVNRAANDYHAIVGQFAGEIVILMNAAGDPNALIDTVFATINGSVARIAVSAAQVGAASVLAAYAQCRDTLHIARRMGDTRRALAFSDLGYLHALYHAGTGALVANPYAEPLRLLLDEPGADLFHTLEVYLDAGGNGVQTADLLTIHRSTLNYRLDRISKILELDLSDPHTRTNLQIALKLLRLFGDNV